LQVSSPSPSVWPFWAFAWPVDTACVQKKEFCAMNLKPTAMSLRFDTLFLVLAVVFVGIVIAGRF
jgi:hypothetical protein